MGVVMNKYAVVGPDNKAINFIMWDGVTEHVLGQGNFLVPLESVERYGIGWMWDGSSFLMPPAVPVVPATITSLQFRREVKARGKSAQVKTWLGTASEDVQLYFEFTDRLLTTDAEFIEFVALIGLTAKQVDQFFIAAAER
jgi:hypothetical protein